MAAGFSCTLAGGTLSGFALSSSARGAGATALTGGDIYVDPFDGGVGDGFILQYESQNYAGLGSGLWTAGSGQQLNFTVSYNIAYVPNDYPIAWLDDFILNASPLTLDATGNLIFGTGNNPIVTGDANTTVLDEASNASAGFVNSELLEECGPLVVGCNPNLGGGFNLQPGAVPTLSDLMIESDFTIDGGQSGTANLLGLWTGVVENEVSASSVPEPSTLLLFSPGLAGLSMLIGFRRRSRKRPVI
jgi:hypothetical protein